MGEFQGKRVGRELEVYPYSGKSANKQGQLIVGKFLNIIGEGLDLSKGLTQCNMPFIIAVSTCLLTLCQTPDWPNSREASFLVVLYEAIPL